MLGIIAWFLTTGILAYTLILLDLYPEKHPDNYAAGMTCTLIGLLIGGQVNDWSIKKWPKAWWNP